MGDNEIGDDKNEDKSLAILIAMDRPIEHVQGFTGSHWMLPSGKCLCCIAPSAAMVNEFVETTQSTNKPQLLASNYGTFRALVVCENFIPKNGTSTQVIDATSFV